MLCSHRRNVLHSAIRALERRLAPLMAAQSRRALLQYCRRLAASVKQSGEAQAGATVAGVSPSTMLHQQPASLIAQQKPETSNLQQLQTRLPCGNAEPAAALPIAGTKPSSDTNVLLQSRSTGGLALTKSSSPGRSYIDAAGLGKHQLEPACSEPPAPATPQKTAPARPTALSPRSRQPDTSEAAKVPSPAPRHPHAAGAHERSPQGNEPEVELGEAEAIALVAACALAAKPHVRIPPPEMLGSRVDGMKHLCDRGQCVGGLH